MEPDPASTLDPEPVLTPPVDGPKIPSNRPSGIGNCYLFKSRLQEYAQKVGFPTPVYQIVKEGPSHEPVFKSTVIVNGLQYESLPGFYNRKAAEHSAAEIALMEIQKSSQMSESIPTVHESGLCKNMLQDYAQKMNYALPSYKCNNNKHVVDSYICTVEIGGIQYIGAAARTKKEAAIKAARTALFSIQYGSETRTDATSEYSVLPSKKKGKEQEPRQQTMEELKPKKAVKKKKKKKKKWLKRKFQREKGDKNEAAKHSIDESVNDENELGSDGMNNDGPLSQTKELDPSATETNGCIGADVQLDGSAATLDTERFENSQEGMITCSGFFQELKPDAIENVFPVEVEEGTLQPIPSKNEKKQQDSRPQTTEKLKPKKAVMKKKKKNWSRRKVPGNKSSENEEAAKPNHDGSPNNENEVVSGGGNENRPSSQTRESEPLAIETNGCCIDDEQRDGLAKLNAERFEDSQDQKMTCSAFVLEVKPNNKESLNNENELGSGDVNENGPSSQTKESEPLVMETNGCCKNDEQRHGLATLNAEIFVDSQERKITSSPFIQEVMLDAIGDILPSAVGHNFIAGVEEGTLQPILQEKSEI